ncbi:hypothetical protein CBER1_05590 [Cercospora berteroae]|uniref:F-box domain-containing protein n=1 Tax=Cercospora berteroae TaxID=357750 RepID=A0A2S6CFK8_9PEZI|nr:hypothetical protein CBER1_05590 [Cercospora berteroae]
MNGKAHQLTTQSSPIEYMAVERPPLDSSSRATAHQSLHLDNRLMNHPQPIIPEPAAAQEVLIDPSSCKEVFDFCNLPRELRDQIYDFMLDEPKHIKTSSLQIGQEWDEAYLAHVPVLSLLLANKQMNQEYQEAIKRAEHSQKLTLVINPHGYYFVPANELLCDEYLASKLRTVPKLESDDDVAGYIPQIVKNLRTFLLPPLLHQQALTNISLIVRGAIEHDIEEEVDFPMLTSALRDCGKNICGAEESDDSYPMLLEGIKLTYCIDMQTPVRKFWKKKRSYYWRTYRATPSTYEDNFHGFELEKLEPEEAEFFEEHTL